MYVLPSLLGNPLKAGLAAAVLMHGLLFVASTAQVAGLGDIDAGLNSPEETAQNATTSPRETP